MSQKVNELENKMKYISQGYDIPYILLVGLVRMAKDEVEVPDCSDCVHKRFHEDPKPSWA